jgi:hypothetical protein
VRDAAEDSDWSLASLTKQDFSLLDLDGAATLVVMHELTHSVAMGRGKRIGM